MNKHLQDVLEYFTENDGAYHIKDGYICIRHGFVDDYVSVIEKDEDDLWHGYSMAADKSYALNDAGSVSLHVYELNPKV
jgi:hypothetical protein